jgi:hypothetical protein
MSTIAGGVIDYFGIQVRRMLWKGVDWQPWCAVWETS